MSKPIYIGSNIDNHLGIEIDYNRDKLFDELGLARLKDSYMKEDETSPQERYAYVSSQFSSNKDHAQRLYDYASNHWLSYSTPILSFGKSKRGLPISCFLNYLDDTSDSLIETWSETNRLSMAGGGVGVHVKLRSSDVKSVGVMPHLKTYDTASLAYRQGQTRRGSYAMYLDINHPDILQFLELRKATGDPNIRCQNLHHGINITDKFMEIIEKCSLPGGNVVDDSFDLVDPHSKKVVQIVSAKELWQRILEIRLQTGEPYLHFIDTANRSLPNHLKEAGLSINGSNLCAEIELPTSPERTAVCCLSSLNLDYYDEWKDNYQFIQDVAEMLDNVLQYFIDNCPDELSRARFSAERERSIGVGVLGFHSYLQSKMIPFEGVMAKVINKQIFTNIKSKLDCANHLLGTERGNCPDLARSNTQAGIAQRFSHTMAVAPTASSSIIMGNTSPSIEPFSANCYRQDTLSGSYFKKNKHLEKVINEYHKEGKHHIESSGPIHDAGGYQIKIHSENTEEELQNSFIESMWRDIAAHDGSIQHLWYLPKEIKDVFKTAMEIDQRWIIELAGDRATLIDQGQSVNVFFRPNTNIKYLHTVHFQAWKKGVKALYYCRSEKLRRADKVSQQIERKIIEELDNDQDCLACSS